jgi:hypothetical protein
MNWVARVGRVAIRFWAAYDVVIMDEAKIREQAFNVIEICRGVDRMEATNEDFGRVVQGTTGIIELLYGRESGQLSTFKEALAIQKGNVSSSFFRGGCVRLALGVLENIVAELDAGLIGSIRQQAAAEVLTDFVALSRSALGEAGGQAKNVAAVLAAAAFEDSVRRLGAAHAGTVGGEKLADVLTALKNSGFLQGPQVAIAQSYLTFRNHAMHAQWDKIESEAVNSVLGFVEQLVLKYFQ